MAGGAGAGAGAGERKPTGQRAAVAGPMLAARRPPLVAFCCAAVAVAAATTGLVSASSAEEIDGGLLHKAGRRLTTSTKCRQALEAMLTNENWNFVNNSFTKWCRIKAENEMARCCRVADFELGRGEECGITAMSGTPQETECFTQCHHQGMIDLCHSYFGKACAVDRRVYSGVDLRVSETFCVPEACDNGSDRESLMNWYSTLYAGRLNGWHAYWDDATLNCPSAAIAATLWTICAIVLSVVFLIICYFLLVAPKEGGKLLISQEDMQAEAEAEAEKEAYQDLRGTAQMGGDALGQTGMSR